MKPPTFFRAALTLLGVAALAACADQPLDPRAAQPAGPALTVIPTNALASTDAGSTHSCGLTSAGLGWCWGRNNVGQLGDSTAASTTVPVAVFHPSGVTFTQVSAGAIHTCAITSAGQAYCWGSNGDGRLGDSTTVLPLMPVAVKPLGAIAFTSISAGGSHTCGLNGSGQAYCWGNNSYAQIGDSTKTFAVTPVAVRMPAGVTFSAIAAGGMHTCALATTGQAYCWGYGGDGAVGNNSSLGSRIPVAVQQPAGVTFTSIATEYNHSCGLTSAGQAYCWGYNFYGQLGDSTTVSPRKVPVAVVQPAGVTFSQLSIGGSHTCGVTSGGQAYCWGRNTQGQFGDGTLTGALTPTAVSQPVGVSYGLVTTGSEQTCGLDGVGQAWCSGRNDFSQLGDGSTTRRTSPVAVSH
jgi:alpha-tubulin suppressor-like RCC1 family protein